MRRPFLLLLAALGSSLATACGISIDTDPMPPTGPFDAAQADASASDASVPPGDAGPPGDGGVPSDARPDAGDAGAQDAGPACADADGDGYGVGADCTGVDCDDADATVTDAGERPCGGAACGLGFQRCVAGVWATTCTGDPEPTPEVCNGVDDDCDGTPDDGVAPLACGRGVCSGLFACGGACATPLGRVELCNGIDDDCDGRVDNGCPATCVWVGPTGSATPTDATAPGTPFRTIQQAINAAAARPALPRRVCVMGSGASCGAVANYHETVTMADGISVEGGYVAWGGSTAPARACNRNVIIQGVGTESVIFQDITMPTGISILVVLRDTTADPATGIAVRRSRAVVIQDVLVRSPGPVSGTNTYGVWLTDGSDATVTRSRIEAGEGTTEAVGVKVQQSSARIVDNCQSIDATNRCTACDPGTSGPGIFGRSLNAPIAGVTRSYSIWLEDAAGTVVDQTGMCAGIAEEGAGMDIGGASAGVSVMRSAIYEWGAAIATGIHFRDCSGGAPLVADNFAIQAQGETYGYGVDSDGGCNPVIFRNLAITTGMEGTPGTGVRCTAGSACVIDANAITSGPPGAHPTTSIGIECNGGCALVARNTVRTVHGADQRGLSVVDAGPIVAENTFLGGCANVAGDTILGVKLAGSWARLENNVIRTEDCSTGGVTSTGTLQVGLVVERAGLEEVDVHSNTMAGAATTSSCQAHALALATLGGAAPGGGGVFRNNLLLAGGCGGMATIVSELDAAADPRVFENQFFHPAGGVRALYDDEAGTTLLTTSMDVNLLGTGMNNADGNAAFCSFPANVLLTMTSPCVGAGTPTGAPPTDRRRAARPIPPTIGAFEPTCG